MAEAYIVEAVRTPIGRRKLLAVGVGQVLLGHLITAISPHVNALECSRTFVTVRSVCTKMPDDTRRS